MLKGRTAVITGASRGIGKAIAIKMAECGADVAIIYSGNEAAAFETCEKLSEFGVKSQAYRCNVADFEESLLICKKIVSDFGKVDILVNNAGITRDNLLIRMSEEDFDSVIDVNLKGTFNFIKHLSRNIMKSSCGRIINISSVSGIMGNFGQINYSASKAGIIGLTKTVAKELAGRAVTCNAIAPGFIKTDMTDKLSAEVKDNLGANIPLRRIGEPCDVAELAVFLSSDKAAYITGEVIRVDGGMSM